jgi:hypothetical protein
MGESRSVYSIISIVPRHVGHIPTESRLRWEGVRQE